jgi:hypothetical protein
LKIDVHLHYMFHPEASNDPTLERVACFDATPLNHKRRETRSIILHQHHQQTSSHLPIYTPTTFSITPPTYPNPPSPHYKPPHNPSRVRATTRPACENTANTITVLEARLEQANLLKKVCLLSHSLTVRHTLTFHPGRRRHQGSRPRLQLRLQ